MRWTCFLLSALTASCAHVQPAAVAPDDRDIGAVFLEGLNAQDFAQVLDDARAGRIGGVVVFGGAFSDAEDLRAKIAQIRAASARPLIFAIDAEGGKVNRLPGVRAPSPKELGQGSTQQTQTSATLIALKMRELGLDLNLAPVVDVAVNPWSPITQLGRSFSDDPRVVRDHALAFIAAHESLGIHTTLKHFPGLGSSSADTHLAPIQVAWNSVELEPYRRIFASGFHGAVLIGHGIYPTLDAQVPASLSPEIAQKLLRGKLGFDGPLISDDLQMGGITGKYSLREAAKQALLAGCDLLIVGQQFRREDLAAVEAGLSAEIPPARLAEARRRAGELSPR